ncbi:MAG: hypothetical protein IKX22_07260 [Prevotella sp.]|nr:hypothetical protein [Prevotella sp.]
MEQKDKNIGTLLGDIGCAFRSNIEDHIKDYKLQKGDDVEWILEPLDSISHSADIVIDAFQYGSHGDSYYELYFHNKNAANTYVAYDKPLEEPRIRKTVGSTINFSISNEKEKVPEPNTYDKTMVINKTLNFHVAKFIPTIWKDLIVPFTEKGIWQAVLLNETKSLFPKGWHGNYLNNKYVFSKDDMQLIIKRSKRFINDITEYDKKRLVAYYKSMGNSNPTLEYDFTESDYEKLASYLDREDIMPSVEIDGDKAVASFCYWNDWSGFCRKIIPVERKDQSVIIGETEKEVLVKYVCGIRY